MSASEEFWDVLISNKNCFYFSATYGVTKGHLWSEMLYCVLYLEDKPTVDKHDGLIKAIYVLVALWQL